MTLRGPWPFGWQSAEICQGDPQKALEICLAHGWAGASVKIQNRSGRQRTSDIVWLRRALPLFRERGLFLVPWVYCDTVDAFRKAARFARLCLDLDVPAAGINAEIEYKRPLWDETNAFAAREFMRGFRTAGAREIYAICSTWAQPSLHGKFPYAAWLTGPNRCDAFGPQCYGSSPVRQLMEAADAAREWGVDLVPTLRAYQGDGITDLEEIAQGVAKMRTAIAERKIQSWNWWEFAACIHSPGLLEALDCSATAADPRGARPALEYDERSDRVRIYQRALIEDGFDLGNFGPSGRGDDGHLGTLTAQAIERAFGFWPMSTPEGIAPADG